VKLTRRRLLAAGTAAAFTGVAGTAYWQLYDEDTDEAAVLAHAATELFGDADPWLGRAYLRAHPGVTSQRQVTRMLLAGGARGPSTADELRNRIRSEYAAGRMVVFEGWYFAESEAAAAALVALR
jgi:hypothetical protein